MSDPHAPAARKKTAGVVLGKYPSWQMWGKAAVASHAKSDLVLNDPASSFGAWRKGAVESSRELKTS